MQYCSLLTTFEGSSYYRYMEIILKGIYSIRNKVNNKVYIGSSKNLNIRLTRHKNYLLKNKHENSYLQKSYNKYGLENFEFSILEECEVEELVNKEIYYIDLFNSLDSSKGYNLTVPVSHPSIIANEEYRKALSKGKKGITPSNYHEMVKLNWKKVRVFKDNIFYKKFESYNEAERDLGLKKGYIHSYFKRISNIRRKYIEFTFEKLWK